MKAASDIRATQLLPVPAQALYHALCRFEPGAIGEPGATLVDAAAHHGLVALLHDRLVAAGGEGGAALAPPRRELAARALLQVAAAIEATEQLAAAGIPCAVFKGPGVALALYGALDLRQYDDIDLLVAEEEALRADGVLRRAGFRRGKPRLELSGRHWHLYRGTQHEFGYRHERTGAGLELHWRFCRPRAIWPVAFAELMSRAAELAVPGRPHHLRTLSLADQALALAIHGAMEKWSRLKWLADLPRLAGKMTVGDREAVAATAARFGLERIVGLMGALMDVAGVPPDLIPGEPAWREEAGVAVPYIFQRIADIEKAGPARKIREAQYQSWMSGNLRRFFAQRYCDLMMPADFDAMREWPDAFTALMPWAAQAHRIWARLRGAGAAG